MFFLRSVQQEVGSYRVVKTLGTEQFRIGFRDGDQAAVYVNAALKVLAADGTVHSLALKWFGTDDTTLTATRVRSTRSATFRSARSSWA
mgnify:CR=1 FL=1